jgi:two-component system NtrC family sensor kinase
MKNGNHNEHSLYSILQSVLTTEGSRDTEGLDESTIKHLLQERPSFTIKMRLILIFLALFLIAAGISLTAMILLSDISDRVQFVSLADRFANEIQHARRSEKNYFLYGSDLSEVVQHLDNARGLLEQASAEFGHVVGQEELDTIRQSLAEYHELADELIAKTGETSFRGSPEFIEKSEQLRAYGSMILERSLEIAMTERQLIATTTTRARSIHIGLLVSLLLIVVVVGWHTYRHIILRLNRLMVAAQRFAAGDFLPMTPQRKYKDEFSSLVVAMNHMMYELDRRQNLLVESHKLRAIGNLTAGVAHELNNPINNIILTAEVLRENYREASSAELEDMVNDLVTQAERACQVVNNLLDFTRESETKREYLHVDQLVRDTVQLAKNQIKLSNVEIDQMIDSNLPPVYGDRKLLIQVFLNLFLNAVDAMPEGGKLSVRATGTRQSDYLSVQISDTGCGIPENIIGSIFNPFFTRKPGGKGTGLGLAVSKGIIERHGGRIEVESVVGVGTTFTIHLPIISIPADIKHRHEGPKEH